MIDSKYLSYLLRHDARVSKLVDDFGFLSLEQLNEITFNDRSIRSTEQQLISIADDPTTKKRFDYERRIDGQFVIRALNGHSFELRENIYEIFVPNSSSNKFIYHLTNSNLIENILKEGLKPMARKFVHLYPDRDRVHFDSKRNALLQIGPIDERLKLYRSKNGYILCPHIIPADLIKLLEINKKKKIK
ncbi:putative RNA 2'-phosphotransferase [Sarcoptes scabiei]|uniref:2'-phosphotransferase n=1 Tax=Sarcoptes scabiei TaxID=52283 RepID=A0A834R164_SARSC|nr:putative RNA 2'-phosphotransferase [Sarcoptes scabiei]